HVPHLGALRGRTPRGSPDRAIPERQVRTLRPSAAKRTPDDARVARDLRAEEQGEHARAEPRAQMGPHLVDEPVRTKLEHHRIIERQPADTAAANDKAHVALAELLPPLHPPSPPLAAPTST